MDGNPSENAFRVKVFNEVSEEHKNLARTNPTDFIMKVHKKFCQKKIEEFPRMCEVARVQNIIKWDELRKHGNRGKYTETYGWSDDGEMKFQFEIPQELYHFMQNLVYAGFWEKHNKKVADRFMNRLCKGEDPKQLLVWVRSHYGREQGKVTSHGM